MIVAVASRKASPGVTTLTALLAAYWYQPNAQRLVIEADASGGSLAARWSGAHGLSWDPGLLALSTTRGPITESMLASVSQPIADSLWVAAAPPAPDQVTAGLVRMGDPGASALAGADRVVAFVDCGRLNALSPALPLARRAGLTILVCRPRLDEVHALAPAVAELAEAGCALGLVCLGDGPYPPSEVARTLGVELLGALPVDDRAAALFDRDGLGAGRGFNRSGLVRRAEELAGLVRARCVHLIGPDTGPDIEQADPPPSHPATPRPGLPSLRSLKTPATLTDPPSADRPRRPVSIPPPALPSRPPGSAAALVPSAVDEDPPAGSVGRPGVEGAEPLADRSETSVVPPPRPTADRLVPDRDSNDDDGAVEEGEELPLSPAMSALLASSDLLAGLREGPEQGRTRGWSGRRG